MGKSTISMAIFNSYVSLPEGTSLFHVAKPMAITGSSPWRQLFGQPPEVTSGRWRSFTSSWEAIVPKPQTFFGTPDFFSILQHEKNHFEGFRKRKIT